MENNSAVVTMENNDSRYTKKCKHFLMVLNNYIKEQIALGQIEARKIYGKLNTADMHTKPLRSSEFLSMAHKIFGQPPPQPPMSLISSFSTLPTETVSCIMDMDVKSQPSNETKRSLLTDSAHTPNSKRRKAHILRYMDADIHVPAV
jgi:hypothetical protein